MRTRLDDVMRRYGQAVTVISRESECESKVKAFLQPILKEREDLPVTATPLGGVNGQRWLYIGPAAVEIAEGDRMHLDDLHLIVQEVSAVYFGEAVLYNRAVLRQEKEFAV